MTKKTLSLSISSIIVFAAVAFVYDYFHVARAEYAEMIAEYSSAEKNMSLSDEHESEEGELPPNEYFRRQYLLEMNPRTGETSPENIEALKQQKKEMLSFLKFLENQMRWHG